LNLDPKEAAAWRSLCSTEPHLASPFYSLTYCQAVARSHPHVYVAVLSQESDPIAFFPLQFRNSLYRLLGFSERLGGDMTDYFGLIAPADFRITPERLLSLCGVKYLYFSHLDETQIRYGLEGENPEPGLMMRLDLAENGYWESLKSVRRDLIAETNRKERQLQKELGPLKFCFAERDWRRPLQSLFDAKASQYRRTGREDILQASWRRRLLELLAESNAPECQGVLSTLYAGDTWVASHFGIRNSGVLHYWFPVYNPALSRYSPGILLLKAIAAEAPGRGVHTIDRGAGDAPHKRQVANASHMFYRGTWTTPGLRSALCRIACSAQWRIEQYREKARA
jgi:CelD/BcsL family acetyltransferase involved in cellulose biosynthesis